jgi:pre-mRNA-processing factor 39
LEAAIKRPYFHVKPLDDAQVANWEQYLTHEVGWCNSTTSGESKRLFSALERTGTI